MLSGTEVLSTVICVKCSHMRWDSVLSGEDLWRFSRDDGARCSLCRLPGSWVLAAASEKQGALPRTPTPMKLRGPLLCLRGPSALSSNEQRKCLGLSLSQLLQPPMCVPPPPLITVGVLSLLSEGVPLHKRVGSPAGGLLALLPALVVQRKGESGGEVRGWGATLPPSRVWTRHPASP